MNSLHARSVDIEMTGISRSLQSLAGVRIAMFTGNYNYLKEGANQALNKLVRHAEDRVGAIVRVYSPVTATPAFEPEGTLVPVPSVTLPGRTEFQLALGLPREARRDIERFVPDLVHVATPDILGLRAQSLAKRRAVPIVASVHTRFETYPEYYGLGRLRPLVEWHLDRFYRRSDLILATTAAIGSEMAATHGDDKIRIWGRGVDTGLFDPARRSDGWRQAHGVARDEIVIAFFGRLVVEKGTDRFARTVRLLRQRGMAVRPLIIGDGPARGRMHEALPDAILTGHLTGIELATAIASGDILINPSLTETFGNVTLEAMASGLAVVAADVASTTNLIHHDVTGLVSASDAASLAEQVASLVAEPEKRRRLGAAARNASLGWRWEHILDSVLESYALTLTRFHGGKSMIQSGPRP